MQRCDADVEDGIDGRGTAGALRDEAGAGSRGRVAGAAATAVAGTVARTGASGRGGRRGCGRGRAWAAGATRGGDGAAALVWGALERERKRERKGGPIRKTGRR